MRAEQIGTVGAVGRGMSGTSGIGDVGDDGAGDEAILREAAFGGDPRAAWQACGAVLPPARSARQLWWRAVAHGARGYYDRAAADLTRLYRSREHAGAAVELSLAHSTAASFLREAGRHARAATHDGRAVALSWGPAPGPAPGPAQGHGRESGRDRGQDTPPGTQWWSWQARADAMSGLAADYLGRGDWRGARRLLDRVDADNSAWVESVDSRRGRLGGAAERACWRPLLWAYWVRAETAMTAGDPDEALRSAAAGLGLVDSGAVPSLRHRIKTGLIHAAALAVAGEAQRSAAEAWEAADAAGDAGFLPLRWAAAMLLAGVDPASAARVERLRARDAAEIARRSAGAWAVRPVL